jgi:hypothetical protein
MSIEDTHPGMRLVRVDWYLQSESLNQATYRRTDPYISLLESIPHHDDDRTRRHSRKRCLPPKRNHIESFVISKGMSNLSLEVPNSIQHIIINSLLPPSELL